MKPKLLLLLATIVSSFTAAAYDFAVDNVYYNITSAENHTCAVTFATEDYGSYSGDVVIPATVTHEGEEYSVTSIDRGAFYDCEIQTLTIGPNIRRIGQNQFSIGVGRNYEGADQVRNLIIADGNTVLQMETIPVEDGYMNPFYSTFDYVYIGRNLSAYHPGAPIQKHFFRPLTNVEFGLGCTEIDAQLAQSFGGSGSTLDFTVPSIAHWLSMTNAEGSVYYNLHVGSELVETVDFEGYTEIPNSTLQRCLSVTEVIIPETVTTIGSDCFRSIETMRCNQTDPSLLTINGTGWSNATLIVPAGCKQAYIDAGFDAKFAEIKSDEPEYTELTYSTSGSNATVTGRKNANDTEIIIPPTIEINGTVYNVTAIGNSAFKDTNITKIVIPASVTSIGSYAFNGCTSLKDVIFEDGNAAVSLGFNFYNSVSSETGKGLFADCPLQTLYLGRDISFSTSSNYGYSPFKGIAKLKTVIIGNTVKRINARTFQSCTGITSLTIGNSVTSIGGYAFWCCYGLNEITIPESVASVESSAFGNLINLKAFYGKFASGDNRCLIINGACVAFAPNGLYSYCIPDGVTSIGNNAFYGCSGLTSVTIPNSIIS